MRDRDCIYFLDKDLKDIRLTGEMGWPGRWVLQLLLPLLSLACLGAHSRIEMAQVEKVNLMHPPRHSS